MKEHDQNHVDPESDKTAAREIFAHAMLRFHQLDTRDAQELRIRRALGALEHDAAPRILRFPTQGHRVLRFLLTAAASVVLVGLVSLFFTSTEPKALALVQASIEAAQKVAVRRYEVRMSDNPATLPDGASATLDVGADRRFVIRARTPHGDQIAGGRSETAEWAVRPDGKIETAAARAWWPRWIFLLDETLTGSPDEILSCIERDYEPRLDAVETIDGVRCRHIHAVRRAQPRDILRPRAADVPPVEGGDDAGPEPRRQAMPSGEPGDERPARDDRPLGPRGPGGPEGMRGPGGPRGPGPGVAPELMPFLEGMGRPDADRPDRDGDAPPRGEGAEAHGDGPQHHPELGPDQRAEPGPRGPFGRRRFAPPDVVPRGEMRARLPNSIDIWIDEESLLVRKIDLRWEGPRQPPAPRDGLPRHPAPPSRLEFRRTEAPAATDAAAWFEPESHI